MWGEYNGCWFSFCVPTWIFLVANLFEAEFERALLARMQASDDVDPVQQVTQTEYVSLESPPNNAGQRGLVGNDPAQTRRHLIQTRRGRFWISGNSILCSCPDCEAPMTVRTWLRLADCWRCNASIQLTREEMDLIEDLIGQPEEADQAEKLATALKGQPVPGNDVLTPIPAFDFDDQDDSTETDTDPAQQELDRLTRRSTVASLLRSGFNSIPAWLMSMLLHLLLILLLALFVFQSTHIPESITLSTFVSPHNRLGGEMRVENPEFSLADDLLMANDLEVDRNEMRDVIQKAKKDAAELVEPNTEMVNLPDLNDVRKNLTTSRDQLMSFAARDPRVRAEIVKQEGGTSLTEAAVARGLRWLAQVQNDDGSWSLSHYDRSHRTGNRGDVAGTSLALLPFLGAGQTHEYGIYRETVARGLGWLINNQKSDGDLRINFAGNAGMYAHGQAAIVLCEALAITGDQKFRQPAQKAIEFIEGGQHGAGGWRYRLRQAGDTSVMGWQLMALQSARAGNLGLKVDDSTFKLADYYLDQAVYRGRRSGSLRNMPSGSLYTYQPRSGRPTAAMTAEAILCRMYLGWSKDDPRMIEAIRWLLENHMPNSRDKNVYYWYYATQVMHHYGGRVWEVWNRRMREILVAGQETRGKRAGSWNPRGYEWGEQGGRIYVTSLSICSLEVYYRHLPIFKQIELQDESRVSAARNGR